MPNMPPLLGSSTKSADRPSACKRGYGRAWRKASKAYLAKHPWCSACSGLAAVVDHIMPHKGDQRLFWDSRNWQGLCVVCHNRKTATMDKVKT